MARINRSLSDPTGGFIGRPMTRDRKKNQRSFEWFDRVFNNPTLPRRPDPDQLMKEAMAWDNNPLNDWPDV